jgi:hypothetical protein
MSKPFAQRARTVSLNTRLLGTNSLRSSIFPVAMKRAQTRIFETPATATFVGAPLARYESSMGVIRICTIDK